MNEEETSPIEAADFTEVNVAELRLNVLRAAGNSPTTARKLREQIWQAYCDANCPFGFSEEGMLIWAVCTQQASAS